MFPLLKVLAIFLIIIIMLHRKFSLGVTMLVFTSVLGFLFGSERRHLIPGHTDGHHYLLIASDDRPIDRTGSSLHWGGFPAGHVHD